MFNWDIISLLPLYNETSINKRIVKRKKLYFSDTGLACYLIGIDSINALLMSPFKGRVVETNIYNEIKKSYLNNNEEFEAYYYRDNNQNEIDLVILKDGKLDLIESKVGRNFGTNSIKGFNQLNDSIYDFNGKCIICLDEEISKISSNIYAFPVKCI